jgi:hypothetical protein
VYLIERNFWWESWFFFVLIVMCLLHGDISTEKYFDIWLAVHHSITFFIITNLIHKFLVHSHKLYKIKFLYMFREQSAHHQEVNDANCTYAASGIVTLCKWLSCVYICSLWYRHSLQVTVLCVHMQPLISSLSASDRLALETCRGI